MPPAKLPVAVPPSTAAPNEKAPPTPEAAAPLGSVAPSAAPATPAVNTVATAATASSRIDARNPQPRPCAVGDCGSGGCVGLVSPIASLRSKGLKTLEVLDSDTT